MVYQQVYLVMETKNIHCLGLNKPNKPVYFSMHSLTGQWDSVRFIGLFGLSVYFSTVYFSNGTGITSVRIHRKRSGEVIYSNESNQQFL